MATNKKQIGKRVNSLRIEQVHAPAVYPSVCTLNVKLSKGGLANNKSRGGLEYSKVNSFTINKTLEDQKQKQSGERNSFRKAGLTIPYCIGDLTRVTCSQVSISEAKTDLSPPHPQKAAQDLWVSSCTSEVFRHCRFKELTNSILQHSSCELSSLNKPIYLLL